MDYLRFKKRKTNKYDEGVQREQYNGASNIISTLLKDSVASRTEKNLICRFMEDFRNINNLAKGAVAAILSVAVVAVAILSLIFGEKAANLAVQIPPSLASQSTPVSTPDSKTEDSGPKNIKSQFVLGVLVDKVYDYAGYFRDNVCPVMIKGKWGVIDENGKFIVQPQWDYMNLCSQDGYLMVGNKLNEETESGEGFFIECGFIDIKGKIIIPMKKSLIEPAIAVVISANAKYLGNGKFSINTYDRGTIYYDNNGNEIPPVDTKYHPKTQYVQVKEKGGDTYQFGIADKDGNVIIKPQYTMAFSIGNGFFAVNEGGIAVESVQEGIWKIINVKNEQILELGPYGCYYVQNETGHGWGESFPLRVSAGTVIVGAVKAENIEAQSLLDKYSKMEEIKFQSIEASSALPPQGSYTYYPRNASDGNNTTAWVEGVPGNGENQWIQFSGSKYAEIKTIVISNGYCSDKDTYRKNNRVKELKIEFSDGTSQVVNLSDNMYDYTTVNLSSEVKTTSVKCTILSVYPGEKYTDTCISELAFFGKWD